MDTAPLKSFATWSRTALIREVTARIAVVLAPASPQRVEQPKAVAALEEAISTAGGGDNGRGAVADRVAYTWFNRIIALRFMDANGYTGIGVVSPQAGVEYGQPEILAEAKRANIDRAAVSQKIRETVTGLLNGTRRSDDPQGEAYALLLFEYCRRWNRAMPFMFEREGDFTELLCPANLLADDSMINRAAKVLTEEVCQDVEVIGWLYQFYISERKDEVFAGFKKKLKAGAAEIPAATQLFTPHWIVQYLVENTLGRLWMLNNPGSRLVDQMEFYIPPTESETQFLRVARPEDLKVIDPACGSGHMLTYAFDLLHAIYQEQGYAPAEIPGLILANNIYGAEIDARAGTLAAFALTMKARAKQRNFFANHVLPKIGVIQPVAFTPHELDALLIPELDRHEQTAFWNQFTDAATLGSLIRPAAPLIEPMTRMLEVKTRESVDLLSTEIFARAERVLQQAKFLDKRYNVVVANPPYMGARNMKPFLADWLKTQFPEVKTDLFAAFFYRCLELTVDRGQLGFMSPFVWMFIPSYAELRRRFVTEETVTSLIQLEYSGFDGATVPVCAFTLRRGHLSLDSAYIRLSDFIGPSQQEPNARAIISAARALEGQNSEAAGIAKHFYRVSSSTFAVIPGHPFAYWISDGISNVFKTGVPLGQIADPHQGPSPGDTAKFVRFWFEVDHGNIGFGHPDSGSAAASRKKWFPFNKGGAFRRWYGNVEHILNWESDGKELLDFRPRSVIRSPGCFFKPAVTWSSVSSGAPAFRAVDPGVIFSDVGQSIFGDEATRLMLLATLNSQYGHDVLELIAPTLHFHSGTIASIPIHPNLDLRHRALVEELISISRRDWNTQETSCDFERPAWFLSRGSGRLRDIVKATREFWDGESDRVSDLEAQNNKIVLDAYMLGSENLRNMDRSRVSLVNNPYFRFDGVEDREQLNLLFDKAAISDLVSYAVGCMFGRYSLDQPGLVLADTGDSLVEFSSKIPNATFTPDQDNVIPIVDGDWFEDDIVTRFRQHLRVAFGDQHFEENLRFVTDSLGVKDLRDYFVKSFFADHVQRYKKRPIYWLFSSPKGTFNALIYMHRYTPSTVSTVLNEYLREFKAKLAATLGQQERHAAGGGTPRQQAAAQKEADRIRKMLLELDEYEHDVLYPLASQQIEIDLDDGVRVNYPKFGAALKKIPGLEAAE